MVIQYLHRSDPILPLWRDDKSNVIVVESWLGNHETAKTILFEEYGDRRPDHYIWQNIMQDPWLDKFRQDPDVAARLDEANRGLDEIRDNLREMLKQPEWQM